MFKAIVWFMKAVLELGALLVMCLGLLAGPQLAALFGFGDSGLAQTAFGLLAGVSAAALLFGVPILVINIHDNTAKTVELLGKIEKNSRPPGFANSPIPQKDERDSPVAAVA